jgi:L-threonylcarbamoyladenylate synthase
MVSEIEINKMLEQAVAVLKRGGVVVFPTETAYGLASDATSDIAVKRVLEIKGREAWKTPPLIVADMKMAETYADFTPRMKKLAKKFWPGALTLVLPSTQRLSSFVIRDSTIAVRVSSNKIARALSSGLGAPITATSANFSGEKECYRVEDVRAQFASQAAQPDFYFDVGELQKILPSTIVRETNGALEILRQGAIFITQ